MKSEVWVEVFVCACRTDEDKGVKVGQVWVRMTRCRAGEDKLTKSRCR